MSKSRTREEEVAIDEEYEKLTKNFRPQFGNESHIRLAEKMGRVANDERLMLKQKGTVAQSNYRAKVYEGKKGIISTLNYYLNQTK